MSFHWKLFNGAVSFVSFDHCCRSSEKNQKPSQTHTEPTNRSTAQLKYPHVRSANSLNQIPFRRVIQDVFTVHGSKTKIQDTFDAPHTHIDTWINTMHTHTHCEMRYPFAFLARLEINIMDVKIRLTHVSMVANGNHNNQQQQHQRFHENANENQNILTHGIWSKYPARDGGG